jgi:NADH:ubiquinone oxidoreductase subunit 2 (subunit N)
MTLNVLATAIILFGISIFYANLLTTNFDIIQTKLNFLALNSVGLEAL